MIKAIVKAAESNDLADELRCLIQIASLNPKDDRAVTDDINANLSYQ